MVQVKDLTELKLEDLWREVKGDDEEGWWGDIKQETLRVVKRLLGSAMEEELVVASGDRALPAHRASPWLPQRVSTLEPAH